MAKKLAVCTVKRKVPKNTPCVPCSRVCVCLRHNNVVSSLGLVNLRHMNTNKNEDQNSRHSLFRYWMEMNGQLHTPIRVQVLLDRQNGD